MKKAMFFTRLACHSSAILGLALSFLSVVVALQLGTPWLENYEYAPLAAVGLSALGIIFIYVGYESKTGQSGLTSDMFGFFIYSLAILFTVATALLLMFHYRETVSLGLDPEGWSASADSTAAVFGVAVAFAGSLVAIRIASQGLKSSDQFQQVQYVKLIQDQLQSTVELANTFEAELLEFQNKCQAMIDLFFTLQFGSNDKQWFYLHNTNRRSGARPNTIEVDGELYDINQFSAVRDLHSEISSSVVSLSKLISEMTKDNQLVGGMQRKFAASLREEIGYYPSSLMVVGQGQVDEQVSEIKDKLSDIASSLAQRGWRMKTANRQELGEVGADGIIPVIKYLAELKSYSETLGATDDHRRSLSVLLMGFYCASGSQEQGLNTLRDFKCGGTTCTAGQLSAMFDRLNKKHGSGAQHSYNIGVFYLTFLLNLQPDTQHINDEYLDTISAALGIDRHSRDGFINIINDYASRTGEFSQSYKRVRQSAAATLSKFDDFVTLVIAETAENHQEKYVLLFDFDDKENASSSALAIDEAVSKLGDRLGEGKGAA